MVLEAEIALSGKITSERFNERTEFVFSNPGTADANNTTEYGTTSNPAYPYYNEILGTFALLKTPKFKKYQTAEYKPILTGQYDHSLRELTRYYQFDGNFDYAFNPAAHVDLSQTSIQAALVWENTFGPSGSLIVDENHNLELMPQLEDDVTKQFVSDFAPIECLSELYFSNLFTSSIRAFSDVSSETGDKLYLRLLIDYVFTDLDANGNPNRAMHILTYPIEVVDMTQSEFQNNLQSTADYLFHNFDPSGSPANLTLPATTYSNTQIVYAHNKITITGDIATTSGKKVYIVAGQDIEVLSGVELSPDVVLQIGLDFEPECGRPIKPVSQNYLRSFCDNGQYKANVVANSALANPEESQVEDSNTLQLNAYPNPTSDIVNIVYHLENEETVSLYISNLVGERLISVVENENQRSGKHSIAVDVSQLSEGMYIYTLQTSEGIESKRLVIAR